MLYVMDDYKETTPVELELNPHSFIVGAYECILHRPLRG